MNYKLQSLPLKLWFSAPRPWSVPASSMPVLVTIACIFSTHYGTPTHVNWWLGLACLVGAVLFHFGGNLISDYFDFKTGVDRNDNTGQRLLVDGIFPAKTFLIYGLTLLGIGSILGIVITICSSIYVLLIGLSGLILTLLYSKLKYNALGDLCIFTIFGILECAGTCFAMLNQFNINALHCTLPVGLLVVSILHANNTRDREFDLRANIKTPAIKIGFKASKIYYMLLIIGAYIVHFSLIIREITESVSILWFTIMLAIDNIYLMMRCKQPSEIANLDKRSSLLLLLFSLALAADLFLAPFI